MTSAFDQRIVQVSIEFEDGIKTFDGLSIYASGQKFRSATMSTCECKIFNLTKDQRNYILSRTSPLNLNRTPVKIHLDVGRESYGTFRLFSGNVSTSGATQPPDIGITLIALTNSYFLGVVLFNTQSSISQLSVIAKSIAANNGKTLDFQATDKQIENFSYSGSAANQLQELNNIGDVVAFIDNEVLTVVDASKANKKGTRLLSAATGMVGIPQITWTGVIVKMMIDNTVQLGNMITVQSEQLPAANGDYIITNIFYEVASRDQQFFYTLTCIAPQYYLGTA